MTFEKFKATIKMKRLTGSWYWFNGDVCGKIIRLKGYKTWLQIYRVSEIDYSNCTDVSVRQFDIDLAKPFKEDLR